MEKLTEIKKIFLINLLNKQIKKEEATEKDIELYNQLKEKLMDGEE